MEQVVVVFAAPVPVGHRVQVTWYEKVEAGLVPSQVRTDSRPAQPVIRDLDTGISYETDWAIGHGGKGRPDTPHDVADAPLADFRVERRISGVVRRCRVVTLRALPTYDVQTHLDIET